MARPGSFSAQWRATTRRCRGGAAGRALSRMSQPGPACHGGRLLGIAPPPGAAGPGPAAILALWALRSKNLRGKLRAWVVGHCSLPPKSPLGVYLVTGVLLPRATSSSNCHAGRGPSHSISAGHWH